MNGRPRHARPDSGLTLIELMIAIVITAMVFIGIFAVIRAGVNTQMFVREMSDAGRQGPAILAQVSEDLRNAYFYNVAGNACFVGRSVEIDGDTRADQIHFLTTRSSLVHDPAITGDEGYGYSAPISEVSYMLKEGPDGFYELHRREQPFCDDEPFQGGYFRMITDRIVSFKVQYTGWDLGTGDDGEFGSVRDREEGTQPGGAPPGANPLGGATGGEEVEGETDENAEDATLLWEDEWSSADKGALPVAVKIELVISPDVDPEVMKRMRRDGRLADLDRSYIHIVLLPQFREDINAMRETYAWDGTVAEPARNETGAAGARGRGARGDARGASTEAPEAGANPTSILRGTRTSGSGANANNPFLNIIRGGAGGGRQGSGGGR